MRQISVISNNNVNYIYLINTYYINTLVHSVQYIGRLTKIILISILEGILKKISYERRDYESADEKTLS